MKSKIIVLQGVPASAKSTWAREFVINNKNHVIISRDSIRESLGEYWVPEREPYVDELEEIQIRSALKYGLNVIIDATNLNPKTIEKWNKLAVEVDADIEFKLFEIDYKTALERDKQRIAAGKRGVGEKVLKRFFKKYFPEKLCDYVDKRKILKPDKNLPPAIIIDIDGTCALRTGRSPYDYSKVNTDKFDPRMLQFLKVLNEWRKACTNRRYVLLFVSGRESTCMGATSDWLIKHLDTYRFNLYMRKKGDHRKDAIIKKEIYDEYIKDKYNVLCVIDDRNQCVDMWREEGLLTLQCYYGDF